MQRRSVSWLTTKIRRHLWNQLSPINKRTRAAGSRPSTASTRGRSFRPPTASPEARPTPKTSCRPCSPVSPAAENRRTSPPAPAPTCGAPPPMPPSTSSSRDTRGRGCLSRSATTAFTATRPRRRTACTSGASCTEHLRQSLTKLSRRGAEIFALRYFEGLDNDEIAEHLGTTPGTVAVTLHRARTRLKSEMAPLMGGLQ